MLALIKDNDKQYISQVLAISNEKKFWDIKIIIFDKEYKSIKMIPMYRKEKIKFRSGYNLYDEAFIFDYDEKDFIFNKKWHGLNEIIEDKNIIARLEQFDTIEISEIRHLKDCVKEIKIPEWYELKSKSDIKNLEMVSRDFHDAIIKNSIREDKELTLTLITMDNCKINLKFIDIIEEDIENKIGEILVSKFDYDNSEFKWTILDGFGGWDDGVDYDFEAKGPFIKCKRVLWNFEFKFIV